MLQFGTKSRGQNNLINVAFYHGHKLLFARITRISCYFDFILKICNISLRFLKETVYQQHI
jgi:hypothetical protein